ncbi:hypothetical protein [Paraburkholderia sp. GAS82]|uniref:hypothetical protein n=1 Tax=Paraburkholderia sp. GAS82 TaxID=3035137 RepID=UPI003D262749
MAEASNGKTAVGSNGSMSSLYGVGGNYDDLVRQTTQASYNVGAGEQFANMANWDFALQGQAASGTGAGVAGGYVGGIPSAYGGVAFNVEQARAQCIADMQIEATNPAIVHASPRPGELNVLVTGVGSREVPDSYGEMRAVPWNLRDALRDPSVASTPGGAILGFGYNVVESVIGNTAALFSPNNLNPVSGEMVSPGVLQRAKEDLVINAGTLAIGGENLLVGATRSTATGVRAIGESGTGQAFAARMDQLNYRMGVTSYVAEPSFGVSAAAGFSSEAKLVGHFEKHGVEFGASSASEYLQVGQDIMRNGVPVEYFYKPAGELRTGYAQFMSNSSRGVAKFGFVGTNTDGAITTIHTESGKSFWKMLNGNPADKTIWPKR